MAGAMESDGAWRGRRGWNGGCSAVLVVFAAAASASTMTLKKTEIGNCKAGANGEVERSEWDIETLAARSRILNR